MFFVWWGWLPRALGMGCVAGSFILPNRKNGKSQKMPAVLPHRKVEKNDLGARANSFLDGIIRVEEAGEIKWGVRDAPTYLYVAAIRNQDPYCLLTWPTLPSPRWCLLPVYDSLLIYLSSQMPRNGLVFHGFRCSCHYDQLSVYEMHHHFIKK